MLCFNVMNQSLLIFWLKNLAFIIGITCNFNALSHPQLTDQSAIENIRFYTEIYPPANYIQDDKQVGITIETMKVLWQQLAINEQPVEFVPWARGYRFALDIENTALFTTSRIAEREHLFKWVGPIFYSAHVMLAKKTRQLRFDDFSQSFNYKVATVRGDVSDNSLKQVGFPDSNKIQVAQIKQAYLMLLNDRVDMIVVTNHSFAHLANRQGFDVNDYEIVWTINKTGNYIAFNVNTPDYVIEQYQSALEATEQQRSAIKAKYMLPYNEH